MTPEIGTISSSPWKAETADQLVRQYIDWIKSQQPMRGESTPSSVGFMLTQSNPVSFGGQIATIFQSGLRPNWQRIVLSASGLFE